MTNTDPYEPFREWARKGDTADLARREAHPVFEFAIHTLTPDVQEFGRHLFRQVGTQQEGRDLLEEFLLDADARKELQQYITDSYINHQREKLSSLYGERTMFPPY